MKIIYLMTASLQSKYFSIEIELVRSAIGTSLTRPDRGVARLSSYFILLYLCPDEEMGREKQGER